MNWHPDPVDGMSTVTIKRQKTNIYNLVALHSATMRAANQTRIKNRNVQIGSRAALYSCHHIESLFFKRLTVVKAFTVNHEAASRHQPYAIWKCNLRNVGCLIITPPLIVCFFFSFFLVVVGASIPIVNSWNPILDTIPCLLDKVRT